MYKNKRETERCKKFILENGGKYSYSENQDGKLYSENYEFNGYYIEFMPENDEIVFIADEGDFEHIPIDYYSLLGAMVHLSLIGVGFKRAYCD